MSPHARTLSSEQDRANSDIITVVNVPAGLGPRPSIPVRATHDPNGVPATMPWVRRHAAP